MTQISSKFKLVRPFAYLDARKGPHNSLAEALAFIQTPDHLRVKGLSFEVFDGDDVVEYQWKTADLSDAGVSIKSTDTIYNDSAIQDEVDLNTTDRHSHLNKPTLDNFGENVNGLPTYNGLSVDKNFIHEQLNASTSWTINHGLNKMPSITLTDLNNNVVYTDIEYISENQVILTFKNPFTGRAIFN